MPAATICSSFVRDPSGLSSRIRVGCSLFDPRASTPASTGSTPESVADLWAEDARHYRALLRDIVDRTAALAQRLLDRGEATPQPEAPPPEITLPLERATRIIRRTVAVLRKLAEPLPATPAEPGHVRQKSRHHIARHVEDVISEHFTGDARENLRDDLYCRLENPDLDDAIDKRPLHELIAEILADLDLVMSPGPEPLQYVSDDVLARLNERALRPRPPPDRPKTKQESSSFLKKRTKKL